MSLQTCHYEPQQRRYDFTRSLIFSNTVLKFQGTYCLQLLRDSGTFSAVPFTRKSRKNILWIKARYLVGNKWIVITLTVVESVSIFASKIIRFHTNYQQSATLSNLNNAAAPHITEIRGIVTGILSSHPGGPEWEIQARNRLSQVKCCIGTLYSSWPFHSSFLLHPNIYNKHICLYI